MAAPIEIFCAYSSEDEQLYRDLEKHLNPMRIQKRITLWHPRMVLPGADYQREIETHLSQASVILLLISSSFMGSESEYVLMERSLKLHQAKQAYVVPILLKAMYLQDAPFSHLEMLPSNKRPVTSWSNREEAFQDIITRLHEVLNNLPLLLASAVSSPQPGANWSPQLVPTSTTLILKEKRSRGEFDVFLCHHASDKPEVKRIGEQLIVRGILPWLDEWELRPGQPWQRLLEEQIRQIRAAAVFVGPTGFGPWQQQEMEAFLREFVVRGCPVIPVLLPDMPPDKRPALPVFLSGMTWVNFRVTEPDPLRQLIWGITGQRPED